MAETNIPAAHEAPEGQNSTVVEATAPAQAETTDFSSKFAHLARKEKSFRAEQRRFQQERDAWKAQRENELKQVESNIYGRLHQDPIGLLSERGVTQDQLTSLLVNSQNPQETNKIFQLEQQNKQLLQKIQEIDKRFEDNGKAAVDQALTQIGHDTKILINSNPSDFELMGLAGEDGIEAVKALCKAYWEEDKVVISVQEAAAMVEQEYLENALKLANSSKVKTKLTPAEAAQVVADATKTQPIPQKTQPTKTLNSQAAQSTTKPLSARERAILAFKGQLT